MPSHNTGPDGEHVEVEAQHLAAARSTVAMGHGDPPLEQRVAQAIADAEARGARGGYDDGHTDGQHDGRILDKDDGALILDPAQTAELRRLAHAMPYGGSLTDLSAPGWQRIVGPRPIEPARLLLWLDQLRARLVEAGEREHRQTTELERLRAERQAARQYLGPAILSLLAIAEQDVANPTEAAHKVTAAVDDARIGKVAETVAELVESRLNVAIGADTRDRIAATLRESRQPF